MSMRIRVTAKAAVRTPAITATRTVMGRRSAARISHMDRDYLGSAQDGEKRIQVALRHRLGEERTPDADAGDLVLHFGLRQQALRVGDFDDGRQAGVVTRASLRFALPRCG